MNKVAGFLILSILLMNPLAASAASCDLVGEPLLLKLVNPKKSSLKNPVSVEWTLKGTDLLVEFDVNVPVQNEKKKFDPKKDFPFQFDVVEVFVTVDDPKSKKFSYYEFEVTPNNQVFNVRIDVTNGKKKFIEGINVGSDAIGTATSKNWSGSFRIPLDKLGWKGDASLIHGNFFAIIGKKPNKSYWSSFLPPQEKASFHMPEFFEPLFECN